MKRLIKKIYSLLLSPFERKKKDGVPVQQVSNDDFFPQVIAFLEAGKQVTIPVKGFSMLPFIRGMRDLVILEKKPEYRPYDMVLFRCNGRYVLHRILSIQGEQVIIQGDGVVRGKERVTKKDIFGKVVTILRDGKEAVDPDSEKQLRKARRWRRLRPIRRVLLLFYRFAPWNFIWLRHQ